MSFLDAITSFFKKYAVFTGRARRSEYWYIVLFTTIVSTAISIAAPGQMVSMGGPEFMQSSAASNLWSLITLVPSLAVTWRRLHDVNKSGKYFFFIFIPIAGIIMLLIQLVKDSAPGANQYGEPVK